MDLLQRSIFLKNGTKFWIFFHHLFQTGLVNHCAKNQPICIFRLGATALGSWKIKIFQFSLIFQNFAILRHPNGQNMFSSDGSQYFHARSPPRIFFQLFFILDLNRLRSLLNEVYRCNTFRDTSEDLCYFYMWAWREQGMFVY